MAINKVVNKSSKSHGAMRNVIEYVLRDEKVREGFVRVLGPCAADPIDWDTVYKSWVEEKKIWDKDSGRMYAHNIISFHKDAPVTPVDVLDIGEQFAQEFFPDHQNLICVHQDKDHLHCHIVTNSVSFIDGHKLHQTKKDLERQKDFTNSLCLKRGMRVAKKGYHYDGTPIEDGEITAWSKDKYKLLQDIKKDSYLAKCGMAIFETLPLSANREDFISGMKKRGWTVHWLEKRRHIVFENENGDKVRDTNILKTFNKDVSKEGLAHEFARQNAVGAGAIEIIRDDNEREKELLRYRKQLEESGTQIGSGLGSVCDHGTAVEGDRPADRAEGSSDSRRSSGGSEEDRRTHRPPFVSKERVDETGQCSSVQHERSADDVGVGTDGKHKPEGRTHKIAQKELHPAQRDQGTDKRERGPAEGRGTCDQGRVSEPQRTVRRRRGR
ncbi:MAG: relaxase/mobilization nuclease domain-containing protein [Lachnospiraceae bacterium]|nr:relaxase/mobilization nuclease domain-containing protein [Lachnospiraceae bacterium]